MNLNLNFQQLCIGATHPSTSTQSPDTQFIHRKCQFSCLILIISQCLGNRYLLFCLFLFDQFNSMTVISWLFGGELVQQSTVMTLKAIKSNSHPSIPNDGRLLVTPSFITNFRFSSVRSQIESFQPRKCRRKETNIFQRTRRCELDVSIAQRDLANAWKANASFFFPSLETSV